LIGDDFGFGEKTFRQFQSFAEMQRVFHPRPTSFRDNHHVIGRETGFANRKS